MHTYDAVVVALYSIMLKQFFIHFNLADSMNGIFKKICTIKRRVFYRDGTKIVKV